MDPDLLADALSAWLADRDRPDLRRRAVAVDGKTIRGASRRGDRVHLLACMDHATRAVLAQRDVDAKRNEIPAFQPLLSGLDLAGVVVTADALHTQRAHADWLVTAKHAHYLLIVKGNQPTLLARLKRLPWHRVPVPGRTRDRGHGRVERRTLKVVTVKGFGFPHAAQVIQVTRRVRDRRTRRWRTTVVYAITSLAHHQASPARLADLIRGHWQVENGLCATRRLVASPAEPGGTRREVPGFDG